MAAKYVKYTLYLQKLYIIDLGIKYFIQGKFQYNVSICHIKTHARHEFI